MTKDKKYMYVGIGVLLVTLILSGVTYAVLTWTSTKTNIGINTDCFTIDYTKGNNITGKLKLLNESDLISEDNQFTIKEGLGISGVNIGINSTCNIEGYGSIYLNITNISDVFTTGDSKGALKYAVLKNTSTITDLASINTASLNGQSFEIVTNGSITSSDKKLLYKTELSNTEISKYIVVIYVDNALAGNDALSGTLKGNISAEAEQARYGETPDYCFNLSNKDETNKTASIGSYNCYEGNTDSYETITDVVIPEEIDGYTIDTINRYALLGKKLTSVKIPDSVLTIRSNAFCNNNLTSIEIPSSVTTIESSAFYNNKLTSITIPASVNTIGIQAFGMNPLINIDVASENTVYDSRDNCNAIIETNTNTLIHGSRNTIIPSSVTKIGTCSFVRIGLEIITIPSNILTIGENAFSGNQLTSLTIPSSVTTIEPKAFSDNPFTSIIVDPDNSVYDSRNNSNAIIETNTNKLVQASKNTVIPTDIVTIGQNAFNKLELENIIIPSSVTTIERCAFCNNKIANITIPSSVTSIGELAFQQNQLTSLTLPESITTIETDSFSYNQLTNLSIPDSVTAIKNTAFQYNNLNYVYISENSKLTSIGCSAFSSFNNSGSTYANNPNLKIYNNTGKAFDWNYIVSCKRGTAFVTGTTDARTSGNITYNAVEVKTGNP